MNKQEDFAEVHSGEQCYTPMSSILNTNELQGVAHVFPEKYLCCLKHHILTEVLLHSFRRCQSPACIIVLFVAFCIKTNFENGEMSSEASDEQNSHNH